MASAWVCLSHLPSDQCASIMSDIEKVSKVLLIVVSILRQLHQILKPEINCWLPLGQSATDMGELLLICDAMIDPESGLYNEIVRVIKTRYMAVTSKCVGRPNHWTDGMGIVVNVDCLQVIENEAGHYSSRWWLVAFLCQAVALMNAVSLTSESREKTKNKKTQWSNYKKICLTKMISKSHLQNDNHLPRF